MESVNHLLTGVTKPAARGKENPPSRNAALLHHIATYSDLLSRHSTAAERRSMKSSKISIQGHVLKERKLPLHHRLRWFKIWDYFVL